ncbi:PAS domain-containing protein [Zavarzinia sp. CC-PAN008]|uniref:PAS domain-containing protein n=1 Tax=Zavarzinia sp. CC-PAN008 TaxID=3243332 RepID=UPI003F74A6BB
MPVDIRTTADDFSGTQVRRFASHWQSLRRGREMPARHDLHPRDFVFCLSSVLLVDFSYQPFRVRFRVVGTDVVRVARRDFTWSYLDELDFPDEAAGQGWQDFYAAMVRERRPLYSVVPASLVADDPRRLEIGLFPLSSDGRVIDKAICVEDVEMLGRWTERMPPVAFHPRPPQNVPAGCL